MDAKILQLKDKRKLGYAEYGKPDDVPVIYFHATPSSRLMPTGDIVLAEKLGLRLIVPDRPGFGMSDFQPDRQLLDWPDDVVELADALNLQRFGVLGVSGGSPYLAACAYKIPERLTKAVMVSSIVPFNAFDNSPKLPSHDELTAQGMEFAEKVRGNLDEWFKEADASPFESDHEVFNRPDMREFFGATFREAFRNGVQGYVHELFLFQTCPWGFPFEDIRAEVYLWHGGGDKPERAHYLSERIPHCKVHLLSGVGHIIPLRYWDNIFGVFR